MHRAGDLILAGLLILSFQLSSGRLLAQGRAVFTGSQDAEPLVAGFRRDVLTQDENGFTLSNGTRGYRHFDDHGAGAYEELDSDLHPTIVAQIARNDFSISFTLDPASRPLEQHTVTEGQRFGIYLQFNGGVFRGGSDVMFGFDSVVGGGPPGNRPFALVIGPALQSRDYFSYYLDYFDATGTAETLTLTRTGDVYTMSNSSNGANFKGNAGFTADGLVHADINGDNGIGRNRTLTAMSLYTESFNQTEFPEGAGRFDCLIIESPGITEDINPLSRCDAAPLSSFLRGDCNDDGQVSISDAVCILGWLFAGGAAPGCVAATNTNGDGVTNLIDATSLLNYLFLGEAAPVEPFPGCGPGLLPADDELGCATPPDCQ